MPASKILVIDDQPINVQLLKRKLEREGLRVSTAYSGHEGLQVIDRDKPDLILLDVMMPDMDGLEVCQRLQANEATRSIPVIFITARTTKESKLEGLAVGAVDYITKPIDLDETLARVQTQLRFVTINREMIDLQRRLEEVRRAATVGAMTQGIAHNLNNLLGVAIGHLDLIRVFSDRPKDVQRNADLMSSALQRIVAIIRQLTTLSHSAPPVSPVGLQKLLESAVARFNLDSKLSAPVSIANPLGDLVIESNEEAFEDALAKILVNAWESYGDEAGPSRPISIRTRLLDDKSDVPRVEIAVEDSGLGLDPEIREHIFEPFISTKRTVGVGMGLTIARHALQGLGGDVSLHDRPGGGAVALLIHPLHGPTAK